MFAQSIVYMKVRDMYYINPDECIDCAACEPVCPVTAIFVEDAVPEQWKRFIDLNYKFDYSGAG